MKIPILLTKKKLLEPAETARKRIEDIKNRINSHQDNSLEIQGLFVMMVSQLEVMLLDILKYFLNNFPQKFYDAEIKVYKEEILEAIIPVDIIKSKIDRQIYSTGYKKFELMFEKFCKTLSISYGKIKPEIINRIIEIKESRNLLIHNNQIINKLYCSRAGQFKRGDGVGDRLKITKTYMTNSCSYILALIDMISTEIFSKYSNYTKIEALKRLWAFLFATPVMPFDDFWRVDLKRDCVIAMKKGKYEKTLASSELKLLGLWRTHFNGDTEYLKNFEMFSLDEDNKKKVLYFLSIVDEFRLE